jgi:energy-coupling factor transport system substrate-specific component
MNLWSWPFAAPGLQEDVGLYWTAGLSTGEAISRYATFYLVTSLWYDAFRAAGNVVLIVVLGGPVLRTLERFRDRLTWQPWTEESSNAPAERAGKSPAV